MSNGAMADMRAVVVGGSSGIGRATALMLAERGAEVVVAGTRKSALDEVAGQVAGSITGRKLDIGSTASLDSFAASLGNFDALVISAGRRGAGQPFIEAPFTDMEAQIGLRLTYTLRAIHVLARQLSSGGSIVLVSGIAARRALPNALALTVTNAGLEAATMGLARELAPIRVNCVSPGRLDTSYWDGLPEERRARMREEAATGLPVGRIGTAEDVARAVCFLLENDFVTGTVLDCDGGMKLI
jgi:NAD(P)-dependent dehydrogenase (short-subunit alcohol dehydrogenase family)